MSSELDSEIASKPESCLGKTDLEQIVGMKTALDVSILAALDSDGIVLDERDLTPLDSHDHRPLREKRTLVALDYPELDLVEIDSAWTKTHAQ